MPDATMLTAADIARLAGVTRATVSHWRRRHPDFPAPTGGTSASPAYERAKVEEWLRTQRRLPARGQAEALWLALRPEAHAVPGLAETLLRLARGEPAPDDPAGRAITLAAAAHGPVRLFQDLHARMVAAVAPGADKVPAPLAALMAGLLGPRGTVLDPACATGTLLVAARERGARALYGEEKHAALAAVTAVRLALGGGISEVRAVPAICSPEESEAVDAVVCRPPFKEQGVRPEPGDPRWTYGSPPRTESELMWLQHCLSRTAPGGRVVLLLPPAVAARPTGRAIRAELAARGALRAVIALPPGAAAPAHLGLHVWVLTNPPVPGPRRVLFADGSSCADGRGVDWPRLSRLVLSAWREVSELGTVVPDEHRRAVPAAALLDGEVDLTPSLHVSARDLDAGVLASMTEGLRGELDLRLKAVRRLAARLSFLPADDAPDGSSTVDDLVRAGDVAILRAEVPQVGDVVLRGVGERRVPTVITGDNAEAAGSRYVLRPAAGRLDPWFLAGYLSGPANQALLDRGPALTAAVVRRLTVPAADRARQRELGRAFKALQEFEEAAEAVAATGRTLRRTLEDGLGGGVLEPL
ncbi:SAM-dependent methyltransferase [Actinorhabdospora filicis]|uniref:SAM-dependent methyltransferase n=1 Tax=Actinorhabdospora filicis TaxID=1785913 RepID=A0A9W6W5Q7_9ACTN|nr:N-6 DNA methylase [Actinorhabdospora filicis]GLZ80647.1 SAM-dependent methyltransferase [Actinorhabdospora filicis]